MLAQLARTQTKLFKRSHFHKYILKIVAFGKSSSNCHNKTSLLTLIHYNFHVLYKITLCAPFTIAHHTIAIVFM